jgi:hypothetical protein
MIRWGKVSNARRGLDVLLLYYVHLCIVGERLDPRLGKLARTDVIGLVGSR